MPARTTSSELPRMSVSSPRRGHRLSSPSENLALVYPTPKTERKNWIKVQIAQPKTAFMREIFTTEMGSAIRLSRTQIVRASETITLEVRDRRNPAVVISRQTLVRNVDYSLDVNSGVLYLTQ